jgi:hypothetical protein
MTDEEGSQMSGTSTIPGAFSTMLLDRTTWDLVVDASGNIAAAAPPYAIAQDVASAIKLFQSELWYDTTKGIPYFAQILGQFPPLSLLKAQFVAAALTVPGVASAVCFISSVEDRKISGQVQITDTNGATTTAGF